MAFSESGVARILEATSFAKDVEVASPVFFRGAPKLAGERLANFFAANIRNEITRAAYLQAVVQFLEWAERPELTLRDSIDSSTVVGHRDRALIGVMVYSFARVPAVCEMHLGDSYQIGRRTWIRLHEKGGEFHEVPAHHNASDYLDAYLKAAGIDGDTTVGSTACRRAGRKSSVRTYSVNLRLLRRVKRNEPPRTGLCSAAERSS